MTYRQKLGAFAGSYVSSALTVNQTGNITAASSDLAVGDVTYTYFTPSSLSDLVFSSQDNKNLIVTGTWTKGAGSDMFSASGNEIYCSKNRLLNVAVEFSSSNLSGFVANFELRMFYTNANTGYTFRVGQFINPSTNYVTMHDLRTVLTVSANTPMTFYFYAHRTISATVVVSSIKVSFTDLGPA